MDFIRKHGWELVILLAVLTLLALVIVFSGMLTGKADESMGGVTAMIDATQEAEFSRYNGTVISGTELLSVARKYAGSALVGVAIYPTTGATTPVYVKNTAGATPYYAPVTATNTVTGPTTPAAGNLVSTLNLGKRNDANYINPTSSYDANIFLNSSGKVVLITARLRA